MPRHLVSVGGALPSPPRPEDAPLPPKDWRGDYQRFFGGRASYSMLDVPKGAPLDWRGPPAQVLAAMKSQHCDWRGRPRFATSEPHGGLHSALGGGGNPGSPLYRGDRRAAPAAIESNAMMGRARVGAVDLPSILTDATRRPELLEKLDSFLENRISAAGVRGELRRADAAEVAAAGDALEQGDLARLDAFRGVLREAMDAHPAFRSVINAIMFEYDRVVDKLRNALRVSTRETLQTTMESMQREIFALIEQRKKADEVEEALLRANRELRDANAEYHTQAATLRQHVAELHDQLQKATQRLFINDGENAKSEGGSHGAPSERTAPGVGFTGLSLHGEHTSAEFISSIRRVALEVEHLRAANYSMGSTHVTQLQSFNTQQSDLNTALSRGNELAGMVNSLKQTLTQMQQQVKQLQEDKAALVADAAVARGVASRLAGEEVRAAQLEGELRQCHELLAYFAEKRGNAPPPELERRKDFPGRGAGRGVPAHLRTGKATVRASKQVNRRFALDYLREFWKARAADPQRSGPVAEFLEEYLAKHEKGEAACRELAYTLDDAWEQLRPYSVDADVTLRVLHGEAPEELYERMEQRIEDLRLIAERMDRDLKKAGRGAGRLPMGAVWRALAEAFPHGTNLRLVTRALPGGEAGAVDHQLLKLRLALWHDRPNLGASPDKEEVDLGALLDAHPPSKLHETLKRRVVQEHEAAWLSLRRECVRPVAQDVVKEATAAQVRAAMVSAAARVPDGELLRRFRRCCGDRVVGDDGELRGEERIDVAQFTDALRRECYCELHAAPSVAELQAKSPLSRGKSSRKQH